MNETQVIVEEVARVALEDPKLRDRIGYELDISEDELWRVYQWLKNKLEEESNHG